MLEFPIAQTRDRFPALSRQIDGRPAVFFDGPAGSQTPREVIATVSGYLEQHNANVGGAFQTSVESDEMIEQARRALADFLGMGDPDTIVFGANMTSLTFMLSRALESTWQAGDEILVTRLDHDANVTPWVLAAQRAGANVQHIDINPEDCTLDLDDFTAKLSKRTRLVAIGAASNLVGTINPIAEISRRAHEVGALVFVDAVHYAPHRLIDFEAWDCDLLACSAYKFFGPHIGILTGRKNLLDELPTGHLRPVHDRTPDRWMHGTQNHEGIAGAAAAVDYLAGLGRDLASKDLSRRESLRAAFCAIETHETSLCKQMLEGLRSLRDIRVWGIIDPDRGDQRTPTVSFTHARLASPKVAAFLGEHGIFSWEGNSYALPLTEALDLEPDGVVRVGLLHYNTAEEVDRLIETLATLPA